MFKYERSLNHNYLVFSGNDETMNELSVNMLRENEIKGLLGLKITKNNSDIEFAYEISRYQNMLKAYETRRIHNEQIMSLLNTMVQVTEELEGYYLNPSGLVLNPKNIYWDQSYDKVYFCYDPTGESEQTEDIGGLTEFILQRADYGDYKSVVYAYELHQAVKEDNFSLQGIIDRLSEVGKESVYNLEQQISVVAEEQFAFSPGKEESPEISKSEAKENTYAEQVPEERLYANQVPEEKPYANQSAKNSDVAKGMAMLFDEEEDDWEKEEVSGKLFGFSKRKKAKRDKAKRAVGNNEAETKTEDIMEESFFHVRNDDSVEERKIFTPQRLEIHSLNNAAESMIIENYPFLIGSLQYAVDGCINDGNISRFHARFDQNLGRVYLSDLNSVAGTFLNGERLKGSVQKEIKMGDKINFGNLDFVVA